MAGNFRRGKSRASNKAPISPGREAAIWLITISLLLGGVVIGAWEGMAALISWIWSIMGW